MINEPPKSDGCDTSNFGEAERDMLSTKLPELRDELHKWCECEVYIRELSNLPKPPNIPDFSVPAKSDHQQRAPEPTQEHKQKAPTNKHLTISIKFFILQ